MKKSRLMRGLSLNILALGFTSMLTDVSSEMVFTMLPFFMVNVLGLEMALVGLIEGAAEGTASLLKVFSGWFSDKINRRKPFAVLGYSLSAIVKPIFGLATLPFHILAIRIIDRVGKGIRTSPRDALIANSIQPSFRGKAFGLHRSMDTIGAVIGPLLAFILFPIIWYRGVFFASIIPGLLAVILLIFLVKEKKNPKITKKVSSITTEFKSLPKDFKIYIIIVGIFAMSNFSYAFFLLRAGELGISARFAPLLYLLFNLVYAIFAFPIGTLADKVGKKFVLMIGYGMFGVTCLGFAIAFSPIHAIILFVAYGMFFAIVDTLQRAIVPDIIKVEHRGTAFGALHMTIGITAFISSLLAGTLWQIYGAFVPFIFGAIISITAAILLSTYTLRKS